MINKILSATALSVLISFLSSGALAQQGTPVVTSTPPDKSPWSHESEASVVTVGGNTTSESYSAKQKTTYTFESNTFTGSARYLKSKSGPTETAKQWDASLRYERSLGELWAAFLQHGAESDRFAGYTQRDNTDVGGKYFFIKKDTESLFSEAGFRYQKMLSTISERPIYSTSGRLYFEYSRKLNEAVSGRLTVEYLPNFRDSKAYLVNYEPSISVMMNKVLSLKVSYLTKYHNKTLAAGEKKEDTTLTTALVAKF